MSAQVSETNKSRVMAVGIVMMICLWGGQILFFIAYVMSIATAYKANGLFWACIVAIPFVGQLLWLGVLAASVGILNAYTYLLGAGAILYGIANVIASLLDRKEQADTSIAPVETIVPVPAHTESEEERRARLILRIKQRLPEHPEL
jgi:hypothetical protein